MRIGVLTGGGDCPGLNAVIRAVTLALHTEAGAQVTGISRGFRGLMTRQALPLAPEDVAGILAEAASTSIPNSKERSEERRVGKECRSRWSPYH